MSKIIPLLIKNIGYIIQGYVVCSIHLAVLFELTLIYNYLEKVSPYENSFNYLTGWPLYFLTMFYYYQACFTHPGKIRKNWDLWALSSKVSPQECVKCKVNKPNRASHCRRCDTCIVRRDHHCFFTNSCVGYSNFKSFFWFLVFGFLGSLHFIIRGLQWEYEWFYGDLLLDYSSVYSVVLMLHVYNMMGFLGLLGHIFQKTFRNVLKNVCTMDAWLDQGICASIDNNCYDLGLIQNWTMAFGTNPFLWLSPYASSKFGVPLGPEFPIWPE